MTKLVQRIRQIWSFSGAFLVVCMLAPWLVLLRLVGARAIRKRLHTWCYRACLRIWGVSLEVEGTLAEAPALIVANHCSYLDIAILGAIGPMRFTPKREVLSWPVIGRVPRAYDAIYVERVPGKAKHTQQALLGALRQGDRICVFPEGTTNDGRTLKPFKATLFSLAQQWDGPGALPVQPISIRYCRVGAEPVGEHHWPDIAWYGEDELISHMWRMARLPRLQVQVRCQPPLHAGVEESRKALANRARAAILADL